MSWRRQQASPALERLAQQPSRLEQTGPAHRLVSQAPDKSAQRPIKSVDSSPVVQAPDKRAA
jgi:hypothetical protein